MTRRSLLSGSDLTNTFTGDFLLVLPFLLHSPHINLSHTGDVWSGIPADATLELTIDFKPAESGSYTIKVYRDNKIEEVFTHNGSYTGGNVYRPASSHDFTFPGGSHYYYLYIYGPDYIYSSPIFIKS